MRIEKANSKDFKDIQKMNKLLFDYEHENFDKTFNVNWALEEFGTRYFSESIKDENACALVAKDGAKVVGYLIGWVKKKNNKSRIFNKQAELENMFVLEKYRNKKVGTGLIEEFVIWSRTKGVDNLRVAALAGNSKAINFYRKCGFSDFECVLEKKI